MAAVFALLAAACTSSPSTAGPGPSQEAIAAYLDQPSVVGAVELYEAMIESGDRRWVPWLLDFHRFSVTNIADREISDGLAQLSGLEPPGTRIGDFQVFGQWAQTQGIDPGAGYRVWKLSLYERLDDDYLTLLGQVPDDLLLSQIHWGGVPRAGIPELNSQLRIPADEATWMVDDELVFGVEVGETPVAYPVRILGHHELANDVIDGRPVALVYCTLCRTALLFDRRVGTQTLEFETSGLLWSSNKIMVDRQTDTLWQHLSGEAIGGALAGEQLTQLPVVTSTWGAWLAEHPDTETLTLPDTVFFPDIPDRPALRYDYTPDAAYRNYYESDDVWFPILDTSDALALKTEVLGLSADGEHLAVPLGALIAAGPQTIVVGGDTFRLEPTAAGARVFDDLGRRVAVAQSFWFAWYGRYPDTAIWSGE